MAPPDMQRLAGWIVDAVTLRDDPAALARLRDEVHAFCARFPVPGLASDR
jgi:glycine/serine hydroxymethyltransferase